MLLRLKPHNRSDTSDVRQLWLGHHDDRLGAVIAVLGFILAGELVMVVTGLAAVFAGGLLSVAGRERAS